MKAENRNVAWARTFVDELARAGVREACIASGSRCTPLVLALVDDGRFRLFPHVDERCAAFFALGMAQASGRPGIVVTTSGTAVANLLPAAIEADQSEVPLLLLTADRPAHLRGLDANQTIEQVGIFGAHVRLAQDVGAPSVRPDRLRVLRALAARAVAAAAGVPRGPVHLNFPFEKPLERQRVPGDVPEDLARREPLAALGRPDGAPFTRPRPARGRPAEEALAVLEERVRGAPRGLILAGPNSRAGAAGPAALRLAEATGYPLLADPLSGARFGAGAEAWAVPSYDVFLRDPALRERLRPQLVVRLGASPTSAAVLRYLEEARDAPQVVVDAGVRWKDHVTAAADYVVADPQLLATALAARLESGAVPGASSWREEWKRAGGVALEALRTASGRAPFEGTVPAAAAAGLPAGGTLFIGSSLPVRDLDALAAPREAPLRVLGHRGASGIDGCVSGALGAAAAAEGPSVAVLGDLSFYHDMNGLLAARRDPPDLVLVVIHNDGGGIFHMLPVRDEEEAFLPYVVMPHGLDFRHVADLYGLPYRRLGDASEFAETLGEELEAGGTRLLVVPSNREAGRRRRDELEGAGLRAARRALGLGADGSAGTRERGT